MSRAALEYSPRGGRRITRGRKDEEYAADFILVSRRTLDADEYQLFNFHFLLGADWKLCCRRLNIDRGTFFHNVYRIQQKLGRVFRELQPFSLYPIDEYFHGVTSPVTQAPRKESKVIPLRAPLARPNSPLFTRKAA